MRFDTERIKEEVRKDFEHAWLQGVRYVAEREVDERFPKSRVRVGKSHPIFDTIQRLREAYIRLGFEEVVNPVFVSDEDVKKQFGKEALAVLDRCFYLAGLPRPDIGISEERVRMLEERIGKKLREEEVEALRSTLHRYKRGELDGDDLVSEIRNALNVEDTVVTRLLDEIFPEMRELKPIATSMTLRSHMTSGWFLTLQAIWDKKPLPIKLFSVDRCFRREQKESENRLRSYYSASCVLCDEEISIDDGMDVAFQLLSQFGFSKIKFKEDEKRSKYYIPGTQTEVFCWHPRRKEWVEVATFGIYSPTALAQYDIPLPVLNLGLGVERLAMILYDYSDVRELVYPQFYADWHLNDYEIASQIRIDKKPSTKEGEEIAKSIVEVCMKHGNEPSPCEFLAFRGVVCGRSMEVWVVEPEENTRLCGPAFLNEVVVHDGSVLAVPREEKWRKLFEDGVSTNIRFLDAFASLAAHEIERGAEKVRVRIVRSAADINIKIGDVVVRYATSKGKKIDIRGPVFITVVAKEI
ncbi:MAG: O-phosphoseryl-tRNA synthetase [Methanophagales archaeon]|nr:O-phosphoserine--tRNA ligase [Methanophagales archaeon]MCU4139842.1 O-phosphoseryl-tRNA synthetase [Methanophagales archaeon]